MYTTCIYTCIQHVYIHGYNMYIYTYTTRVCSRTINLLLDYYIIRLMFQCLPLDATFYMHTSSLFLFQHVLCKAYRKFLRRYLIWLMNQSHMQLPVTLNFWYTKRDSS